MPGGGFCIFGQGGPVRTFRGRPGAGGLAPGRRLRFIGYSRSRHALAVLAGIALLLGVVAGGTVPAAAGR